MANEKAKRDIPIYPLKSIISHNQERVIYPDNYNSFNPITKDTPVLIVLAAGKGTRFGKEPKCIQDIDGKPLARHSIDSFKSLFSSLVICVVGHKHDEVMQALGDDILYVRSDNPIGGTAYAAYEAFSVPSLYEMNPPLIITMGDRIVPECIFQRLAETNSFGADEADLTFLTAQYEPPKNHGKGRIVRDENQKVLRIVEERDIQAEKDESVRQKLLNTIEGNCPLYMIRAQILELCLGNITNANAQNQFYLTDIIKAISENDGTIKTVTTKPGDPEYDLLCSDVTKPDDLARLEKVLALASDELKLCTGQIEKAAQMILQNRSFGQVASIARQLETLVKTVQDESLDFEPDCPVGIGIAGGRLRIAFMHPDMVRFYGPAWQMPIGANSASGDEQITILAQASTDEKIRLYSTNSEYREKVNFISSDNDLMYPEEEFSSLQMYENFGTRLTQDILKSLGYTSDEELERLRKSNQPLPHPNQWISNGMRRPFSLVGNALASIRTLKKGTASANVMDYLSRENFKGLRITSTGKIPKGGFSSSSAVTLATGNAINALFNLGISNDLLVTLACKAEYGTGVRAGALDQSTIQLGQEGKGSLISSNPRDNYRTIDTYPLPTDRIKIIYPYSVERDSIAWKWSWGFYADSAGSTLPTSSEIRNMTGKAAEIAAILTRLPLNTDFFKEIEDDLVRTGKVSFEKRSWICSILRQLPLLIKKDELRQRVQDKRDWYAEQVVELNQLDRSSAEHNFDSLLDTLLTGWRDPVLRRTTPDRGVVTEVGMPLRAIVAYLFAEVAKNFYLIHYPDQWIECVQWSQQGDRCVDIDFERLPDRKSMEGELDWEQGASGVVLLNLWLERFGATLFDYNRGLDDVSLSADSPPEFHRLEGSNFFRGLALIDLVEAMLKRAFGCDVVAVRINGAGQGDFFQVHVDKRGADPEEVKNFLRVAFYRRFGLNPQPEFVEPHAGGSAVGVRLNRYGDLPILIRLLKKSL